MCKILAILKQFYAKKVLRHQLQFYGFGFRSFTKAWRPETYPYFLVWWNPIQSAVQWFFPLWSKWVFSGKYDLVKSLLVLHLSLWSMAKCLVPTWDVVLVFGKLYLNTFCLFFFIILLAEVTQRCPGWFKWGFKSCR